MPFLVDSISMEITRHGNGIHLMIRPIVRVRRDDEGNLEEVVDEGGIRESTIHVELDKQTDPQALAELRDDLVRVLGDVHAAVSDWPAMLEQAREIADDLAEHPPPVDPEELAETVDLLEWMRRELHLPRLPRVRDRRRGGGGGAARRHRLRARHPAPERPDADLGQLRAPAARRPADGPRTSTCST